MAQLGLGQDNQWRENMTDLAVNNGIKQSVSILAVVIRPLIKINIDNLPDGFHQHGLSMLVIR